MTASCEIELAVNYIVSYFPHFSLAFKIYHLSAGRAFLATWDIIFTVEIEMMQTLNILKVQEEHQKYKAKKTEALIRDENAFS